MNLLDALGEARTRPAEVPDDLGPGARARTARRQRTRRAARGALALVLVAGGGTAFALTREGGTATIRTAGPAPAKAGPAPSGPVAFTPVTATRLYNGAQPMAFDGNTLAYLTGTQLNLWSAATGATDTVSPASAGVLGVVLSGSYVAWVEGQPYVDGTPGVWTLRSRLVTGGPTVTLVDAAPGPAPAISGRDGILTWSEGGAVTTVDLASRSTRRLPVPRLLMVQDDDAVRAVVTREAEGGGTEVDVLDLATGALRLVAYPGSRDVYVSVWGGYVAVEQSDPPILATQVFALDSGAMEGAPVDAGAPPFLADGFLAWADSYSTAADDTVLRARSAGGSNVQSLPPLEAGVTATAVLAAGHRVVGFYRDTSAALGVDPSSTPLNVQVLEVLVAPGDRSAESYGP